MRGQKGHYFTIIICVRVYVYTHVCIKSIEKNCPFCPLRPDKPRKTGVLAFEKGGETGGKTEK